MEYRIDPFSIFIFLGIVQAVFLSFFFFSAEHRAKQFNVFFGLLLISIACCLLEIFLMYSGYIIHLLHLADFSEPMALLIGPFYYLFIASLASGKVERKQVLLHMVFPAFYTITQIPFLISSTAVKYNAWIGAYHPELPFRDVADSADPRWFFLTNIHTELVLLSLLLYIILSIIIMLRAFRVKKESLLKPQLPQLRMLRNAVLQITSFSVLIVIVKLFNQEDTGDHLFAAFGALQIYTTSFVIIGRSGFFKQASLAESERYKNSAVSEEVKKSLLEKLSKVMQEQKPYLQSSFSLPDLAALLGTTVHILSQVINDGLGKSFFEMLAEYRIKEAANLLKERPHIKVEEIAEQVGYNSKSSFNTAFKKITGKTPSEYRVGS